MKKLFLLSTFTLFTLTANAQSISGRCDAMNNGIAPVAAFGLGEPAGICALSVTANVEGVDLTYTNFSAVGLTDGQHPWFWDNWFRVSKTHGRMTVGGGVDLLSYFFQPLTANVNGNGEEDLRESTRYRIYEGFTRYKVSESVKIGVTYWYTDGLDSRTISGHFIKVAGDMVFSLGNSVNLNMSSALFRIEFTGANDGDFASMTAGLSHKDLPFSVYVQGIGPLDTNIEGLGFEWTLGTAVTF